MTQREFDLILLSVIVSLAMISAAAAGILILTGGQGSGGGSCGGLDFTQTCNSQYIALGGVP
jgi:hypothetical protein